MLSIEKNKKFCGKKEHLEHSKVELIVANDK
jgi:hypothetical protein